MSSPRDNKRSTRELTTRAIATGVLLGALLTPCNIYSGLKLGWSFNMSIAALLLGYMFWQPLARLTGIAHWDMHESNISQTAASSAASIISGGLVAPLPALAMLTGENLPFGLLVVWVFAVSFLGIWVGWYMREGMIVQSPLVFPAGVATAETMRDVFSHGREGLLRVWALLGSLFGALLFNFVDKVVWMIPRWSPSLTAQKLTFFLDPSLLLLGFGSIIGLRAGLSLLTGAVVAWGFIAPRLIASGLVEVDSAATDWFQPSVGWLLWPGVALMLTSSLTNVAFAIRKRKMQIRNTTETTADVSGGNFRRIGMLSAAALVVILQILVFDIHWTMAILAVPMSFLLAVVAARVTGETGIPPIGALGKVSQLSFGVLAPAQPVTNLMTANVAGGVAGQTADLLNDLKAGQMIGATPKLQIIAQCFGVLAGSLIGSYVYLSLIPNPVEQLLTPEWPAPAVAVWKAVAEMLSTGLGNIPQSAVVAAIVAGITGLLTTIAEQRLPEKILYWWPSGSSIGLAFVVPASTSLILFMGALLSFLVFKVASAWSRRFLLSIAAGLVAGESLFGVFAIWF